MMAIAAIARVPVVGFNSRATWLRATWCCSSRQHEGGCENLHDPFHDQLQQVKLCRAEPDAASVLARVNNTRVPARTRACYCRSLEGMLFWKNDFGMKLLDFVMA